MTIGWEHEFYTVGEADGHLDVCARFNGTLESTLPQSRVTVEQGTAIENQGSFMLYPKSMNKYIASLFILNRKVMIRLGTFYRSKGS